MYIMHPFLGGGFKDFLFSPLFGEDFRFDEHIFQMGWFNHQLDSNFTFLRQILSSLTCGSKLSSFFTDGSKLSSPYIAVYSHGDWETCGHDVWNADGLSGRREVKRGG